MLLQSKRPFDSWCWKASIMFPIIIDFWSWHLPLFVFLLTSSCGQGIIINHSGSGWQHCSSRLSHASSCCWHPTVIPTPIHFTIYHRISNADCLLHSQSWCLPSLTTIDYLDRPTSFCYSYQVRQPETPCFYFLHVNLEIPKKKKNLWPIWNVVTVH